MNNHDTVNLICAIIAGGAWVVAFLKHLAYRDMKFQAEAWKEIAWVGKDRIKHLEAKLKAKFEQELEDLSKPKSEIIVLSLSSSARLEDDIKRKEGIKKDMQERKLSIQEIEAKWGVTFIKDLPYDKETNHESI